MTNPDYDVFLTDMEFEEKRVKYSYYRIGAAWIASEDGAIEIRIGVPLVVNKDVTLVLYKHEEGGTS